MSKEREAAIKNKRESVNELFSYMSTYDQYSYSIDWKNMKISEHRYFKDRSHGENGEIHQTWGISDYYKYHMAMYYYDEIPVYDRTKVQEILHDIENDLKEQGKSHILIEWRMEALTGGWEL